MLILKKLMENYIKNPSAGSNLEEEKVIETITFAIYNLSLDSCKKCFLFKS